MYEDRTPTLMGLGMSHPLPHGAGYKKPESPLAWPDRLGGAATLAVAGGACEVNALAVSANPLFLEIPEKVSKYHQTGKASVQKINELR